MLIEKAKSIFVHYGMRSLFMPTFLNLVDMLKDHIEEPFQNVCIICTSENMMGESLRLSHELGGCEIVSRFVSDSEDGCIELLEEIILVETEADNFIFMVEKEIATCLPLFILHSAEVIGGVELQMVNKVKEGDTVVVDVKQATRQLLVPSHVHYHETVFTSRQAGRI